MSESGERQRLFYAVWPPPAVRVALALAGSQRLALGAGRAVPAANLHLTLAFLGLVAGAELDRLEAIGARLRVPAALLTLDRIDWWPRAQVLVAAATEPPPALLGVQRELTDELKDGGFRVDSAAFRPHVTLARKLLRRPSALAFDPVEWPLGTLALCASRPSAGGSIYTPLVVWELGDSAAFPDRVPATPVR